MKNGEFSQLTIKSLYKRAGEHCSICKKLTSKPHSNPEKFHNLGEAAHINGLKDLPNLRFDPSLSNSQLSHINNGIWLCGSCHHEIDNDCEKFSASHLQQIKKEHEQLVIRLHENGNGFLPALAENEKKITLLEQMIFDKEKLLTLSEKSFDLELTKAKFELEALRKENSFLLGQLKEIQKDVFDINNPKLNAALLDSNGVDEALEILDDTFFEQEEMRLAKSRLLRAKLLTVKGNLNDAESQYRKAFELYPCTNLALSYISFLVYFKLDFEGAVKIANDTFILENDPRCKAELLAQQAQATLILQRHEDARHLLEHSKKILEEHYPNESWAVEKIAKLEKHIGDCYKMNFKYEDALKSYEKALNIFFRQTLKGNDTLTVADLAGLATAIGLLYEQNNMEQEAIIHHLRAVGVLENIEDTNNTRALIFMNVATCYLQRKTFNPEKALSFALRAHEILIKLSDKSPRDNMEYLLGSKCLLADIYQLTDRKASEKYYIDSLNLAEVLVTINPVFLKEKLHVLHNYACFHMNNGNIEDCSRITEECISLLHTTSSTLMEKTVGLSKALLVKLRISEQKEDKKKILQQIIEVNKDTPSFDKTYAYKLMAEKILSERTSQ